MRDEDFLLFIDEFGEANSAEVVPEAALRRWAGRLPGQLLTYWRQEGWCSYGRGLVWTVDPDAYEALLPQWLEGTPLAELDTFHVFARSAFGDLFLCGEQSGANATVCCSINTITAVAKELRAKDDELKDASIRAFFAASFRADFDRSDIAKKPLFDRAFARLGVMAPDEMYGFEPALALGGTPVLDHLRRVKTQQHLALLRQLAMPRWVGGNLSV